ncbi:MAG: NAD-dependent epimerase/dehydratase family protein [Anaerolinea sp.]|nr:NAD-dependent epimerase/dehydratase family protein [Anaerolinea sp.]
MNILITGAFGNVGTSLLRELLPRGRHHVRCFDVKSPRTERVARRYAGQIEVQWGDIRNAGDVRRAVEGRDVVIHLIAIIPPKSDLDHAVTRAVNVGGTQNILDALAGSSTRLIYSSSLALFGATQHMPPPRTVSDPIQLTDVYTETKAECERLIKASGVTYALLRFGAVLPIDVLGVIDPLMFDVPLGDRMEFVHTYDIGLALANAIDTPAIDGKTLLVGGGKRCQIYQREVILKPFEALGIGMLPESAFGHAPYHLDWLDTTESQRLLCYQRYTFDDYVRDVVQAVGWRRAFIRVLRPLIRRRLLAMSPYYKA